MQYIKIDDNTWVEFNEVSKISRTIMKDDLENQKADIEQRISEDVPPTDEELLLWAKQNFPMVDHTAEEGELLRITDLLGNLK